ncbi:MAG: type II toxin-antitoxin system VapC family toxin [Alphaproteobacteria bacterium]|nr:type II toxin-antitoxin system VapC family toxin [Alphaproteobacteria bacterium]
MILVDTSVWIGHFRAADGDLIALLIAGRVVMHDHVLGELALGSLKDRAATLKDLANLARAPLATEAEVRSFIEFHRLFRRGVGYVDAHLLASVMLGQEMTLWTRDSRLAGVADEFSVAYRP